MYGLLSPVNGLLTWLQKDKQIYKQKYKQKTISRNQAGTHSWPSFATANHNIHVVNSVTIAKTAYSNLFEVYREQEFSHYRIRYFKIHSSKSCEISYHDARSIRLMIHKPTILPTTSVINTPIYFAKLRHCFHEMQNKTTIMLGKDNIKPLGKQLQIITS